MRTSAHFVKYFIKCSLNTKVKIIFLLSGLMKQIININSNV